MTFLDAKKSDRPEQHNRECRQRRVEPPGGLDRREVLGVDEREHAGQEVQQQDGRGE